MKQAIKNRICFRICWILLAALSVGWLLPASAEAESEQDNWVEEDAWAEEGGWTEEDAWVEEDSLVEKNGWVEEDGKIYYYTDGEMLQGCIAGIEGEFYYFRDDGRLLTEDETCLIGDGEESVFWVRAGWDNILLAGQWYTDDTKDPTERYYYGEDFAAACGPTQIDGEFYLFDSESGLLLYNQKVLIEDRWWESDYQGVLTPVTNEQESGETLNGWVMDTEGNTLYYRDGKPLSGGFYDIDGEYRFFHDNGRMAKSESLYLDNHWVRFDEDGHVISDTNREPETQDFSESTTENSVGNVESPVPTDNSAAPWEGWITVDGERYYYRNGQPISAGRHYIEWTEYCFDENGRVIPDTDRKPEDHGFAEAAVEDPVGTGENPVPTDNTAAPWEGWMTVDGERYYYRNGQPISAGRHYIEWTEYYFDENGRLLHDCIADDHVLASDGSIVQSGLVKLGDHQYYVNPQTHLIERNTEINIDNKLYLVDADGGLQLEDLPGMPVPESATEAAAADSSSDEVLPESEPDPDAGYVPVNEDDGGVQETLPAGGSIRYSDDYESDSASFAGKGADGAPVYDNPSSGILLWREGEWVELHGSPENPIEIHIYGRRAAFMNGGTALRDAFLCNSEGVYGFDSFGGALPAGFVTRYGKLFYLSAPDPDAEMLVLLLS